MDGLIASLFGEKSSEGWTEDVSPNWTNGAFVWYDMGRYGKGRGRQAWVGRDRRESAHVHCILLLPLRYGVVLVYILQYI